MKNVDFAYKDKNPVLSDFSLNISKGERVMVTHRINSFEQFNRRIKLNRVLGV